MAAIENRPDDGIETRCSTWAPSQPVRAPTAAPTESSRPASSTSAHHACDPPPAACSDSATTRITTGASLNPDSASSVPLSRRGRLTRRSTEKTAAASVGVRTAPTSSATGQETSSRIACAATPTTPTETTTPTVDRAAAGPTAARIEDQLVVMPPSARITTRAT